MRVSELVEQILGQPVGDTDGPGGVPGWDSITHLELVLAIENAFGVSFSVRQIERCKTVAQLQEVVDERQG